MHFRILLPFLLIAWQSLSAQKQDSIDYELILAAYYDDMHTLVSLLDQGADVNSITSEGVTPLMYASENGNSSMVELLINSGADVNASPEDGFTALMSACLFNHLEAAVTLIENGADINVQNIFGATPLMIAAAYGYYIITDMLLFYNADTELRDIDGNTALIIASAHGYDDIVRLLLDAPSDINAVDGEGHTPLMAAVIRDQQQVFDLLLSKGAHIENFNEDGFTALMLAIVYHRDYMAKELLKAGADYKTFNRYGHRAETLALMNHNREIFKHIKSKEDKRSLAPFIQSLNIYPAHLNIGFWDVMFENAIGIGESKYHTCFFAGYATRISHKKILVPQTDLFYNQYHEKRKYVFAGMRKNVNLYNSNPLKGFGIDIQLRCLYTYGTLRGVVREADSYYLWAPGLGFYYSRFDAFGIRLGYEYMNLKTYKLSPHRISLGISLQIGLRRNPRPTKSVFWVY